MEWLYIALGMVLILGTGFFVAVEFALVALDKSTVAQAVEAGERGAKPLYQCLTSLSTQLSSCQLGITLTTLLTGYVLEPAMSALISPLLEAAGVTGGSATAVSVVLSMTVATLLSMLIGELIPKNLAIARAMAVGKALARPQLLFTAIFKPAIVGLNGFSNQVLKRFFNLEAKEEISAARSARELASLVRRSAELGTLDNQTAKFVESTIEFSERTAADVMTPRTTMATIDSAAPLSELINLSAETGFSRFPVIAGSSDEIQGVCHIKRVVSVPRERRGALQVGEFAMDTLYVPETIHLDILLEQLREAEYQVAVVMDEYGGTAGFVTLEDLIEEIVGEVSDEHDEDEDEVLQQPDGSWLLPGMFRPDQVNDHFEKDIIPEEASYDTIGGFMLAELGRLAELADAVDTPAGHFTVTELDGRRIAQVRFTPAATSQEADDE
ncbi:hemolysin family protein [Glutamicibacter sp. MNS18]|uniref:hemolysin family protein n=1 Tax=Glutamicibacter sp. MNS18 TaxID=2989817 RepID=UPI002235789F|nr:hemolysin family protein [Glutamicibacter sp. MNS18]MCW4467024.1 hemolysin family protein [Glutamicibacter sp. MNS18]